MDIEKRLESEEFVGIAGNKHLRIKYLNSQGIFTIKEFLDCDILTLFNSKESREKVKIEKDILSYKYLGEPMARDILLTSEISISDKEKCKYQLLTSLESLGFGNYSRVSRYFSEIAFNKILDNALDSIKVIDYLKCCSLDKSDVNYKLILFYIDYYNAVLHNRRATQKNDLQKMKDELVELLIERKKIDERISNLTLKIEKKESKSKTKKAKR